MPSTKPKIAVLIDWYLPGTKAGGPVRSVFSMISVLKTYYDFYVLTTDTDLGSNKKYLSVTSDRLIEKEGVHYYYFSTNQLTENNLLSVLSQIDPQLIYLNSFWSFNFSIRLVRLKAKNKFNAPLLLAPRGMLGKGALSLKRAKKIIFLALAKIFRWYMGVTFHATQEQEETDIKKKFAGNKIIIAPNINAGTITANRSIKETGRLKLFYLSRISRVKNLHFALTCLKNVSKKIDVEYDIYGNLEDQEYWKECSAIIQSMPPHVKVNYKGELKFDEVQNVIAGYNCLFLPTLNENFGHSIVESLLCGCPVIISDQTPWTDLQTFEAGYSLPLEKPESFTTVLEMYGTLDETDFAAKSKNAINYISKKIDLNKIINQYKVLFDASIKN